MLNQILRGGGVIYDEHDNLTLSKNSLKVSPKNPFNDPNLYPIYKQEDLPEWITYTCKKNVKKDFTISFWVYLTGSDTYGIFDVNYYEFYWSRYSIYFSSKNQLIFDEDKFPLNKWVYITCVNYDNQITVYYNGIKQGTVSYNDNLDLYKGGYLFSAYNNSTPNCGISGYIFDFFISDKAIWKDNFIPPNEPFVDGDDRIYLDNDKNIWGCKL